MGKKHQLTKEQKMQIVSKAIDAGFNIRLSMHRTSFENAIKLMDEIVGERECEIGNSVENETAWLDFEEGELEISLFFNRVE